MFLSIKISKIRSPCPAPEEWRRLRGKRRAAAALLPGGAHCSVFVSMLNASLIFQVEVLSVAESKGVELLIFPVSA